MPPEELWNSTLGELELELSKANFTTWFKDTFILTNTGGSVVVGVPNTFTKTWLENKYHHCILKALRRISDDDIKTVSYTVSSKQKGVSLPVENTHSTPPVHTSSTQKSTVQTQVINSPSTLYQQNTITVAPQPRNMTSAAQHATDAGLNPRYTFENFIVGKKNELAHAACLAIAERPGVVYNPLFIYGGVGLGKTHLMQAVGHTVLQRFPEKKILYVTCESFTNEYIKAVGEGLAGQFKEKYRSVDLFMVDDIQFLAGKEGTQEAFFHTFNHLHQYNKQVILTSDRPPRAIPTLEPRLFSRFEAGMIVDVNTPDLETRIAILKQKCRERNYVLSEEIAQFIASNVQNNIRELEGVLNRVIAHHQLQKQAPTLESVKSLLTSLSQTPKRGAVTTKKILSTVASFYEVELKDLIGDSRKKELVVPRQISMYLMREEIHASYPNIGQDLGGRDHTTAMHACQKITKLVGDDEKIENDINMIKQRLYN
ncbi:MAG TPA: chromosomal replication initiator protein DnaA [Patescibacteria group bacterium]|nr:chromosomal replication initiator protein DnaA [Patescibacteria group bacterium]